MGSCLGVGIETNTPHDDRHFFRNGVLTLQSGLWNLGEGVIGWSKDGEGRSILDSVDKVSGLDSSHQGGESWISSKDIHQVSSRDQHDSINKVDDSIGGFNISFCDLLAIHSNCAAILSWFAVDIDSKSCSLHSLEGDVIAGLVTGDGAGDHMVQQHLLQQLHVAGHSSHQVCGQSSKGGIGWGKHGEGSIY